MPESTLAQAHAQLSHAGECGDVLQAGVQVDSVTRTQTLGELSTPDNEGATASTCSSSCEPTTNALTFPSCWTVEQYNYFKQEND